MNCEKPDCNWPKCVGPAGCMRSGPPPTKPIVATKPPPRIVWKTKVVQPPTPAPKKKRRTFPVEKLESGPRSGRSVSINGELHERFKTEAETQRRRMSSILEEEIRRFFFFKLD